MPLIIDTEKYLDTAVSLLHLGHTDVAVPIVGSSMRPFLKEGDTVYLSPLTYKIKKGDILLYTRTDGSYVLHRAAKIMRDGTVMMIGDNQTTPEPVTRSKLLAEAATAKRNGKFIDKKKLIWSFYRFIWVRTIPLRPYIARLIK